VYIKKNGLSSLIAVDVQDIQGGEFRRPGVWQLVFETELYVVYYNCTGPGVWQLVFEMELYGVVYYNCT
ncbi:hypothetical protein KI387_022937, partial [Taxus chinensis]